MSENKYNASILFKDGTVISAKSNIKKTIIGELVFNTSMTGYQEILTDPSYYGQIVIMTYPLIGNYGICDDFIESNNVRVLGYIIKEALSDKSELSNYLIKNNVFCISDIDTRKKKKKVRICGSINCLITTDEINSKHREMLDYYTFPKDTVSKVSRKIKEHIKGNGKKIAVIDLGVKKSIIKQLINLGLDITIFPYNIKASVVKEFDYVLFSNGPGDPMDNGEVIKCARELMGKIPLFGICLGHQILALAGGAATYKLKFGHRGGNHPVINTVTNKVIVTSQNHGYAVHADTFAPYSKITYINLNDNTVEGFENKKLMLKAVQFHPEAGPGPNDANSIFKDWFKI